MIVAHPDFPGGRTTKGLMGAIDLAPTLMTLAGLSADEQASRIPGLPGLDVSGLLASPTAPTERDRQGHLFTYAAVHTWAPTKDRTPHPPAGAPDEHKRLHTPTPPTPK